ncbi:MAG TPA: hypothetical protein VN428_00035 [Bryobacteraceae bacterium]|nr:hypothetical protein [Bryobacteraceae bacterium]
MNIYGRLLLTAAAVLALPRAIQAKPPIVIGDGSVCMDIGKGEPPFPAVGNTHAHKVTILRIIVDTIPGQAPVCAPRTTCKGATDCSEHAATAPVTVFYAEQSTSGTTAGTPMISVTYDPKEFQLNFALGGADWADFGDLETSGRQRIVRKTASIDRVLVSGKPVKCHPCRVTFVAK